MCHEVNQKYISLSLSLWYHFSILGSLEIDAKPKEIMKPEAVSDKLLLLFFVLLLLLLSLSSADVDTWHFF